MLWSGSSEGVGRWMPKLFCLGGKKTTNSTLHTLHYIHFLISRFISEKLQKYPPVLSRHPAIFPDIFHQISRPIHLPPRPAMVRVPASPVLPHPSFKTHSLSLRLAHIIPPAAS